MSAAYPRKEQSAQVEALAGHGPATSRKFDDLRVVHFSASTVPVVATAEGDIARWPFLALCVFDGSVRVRDPRGDSMIATNSLVVLNAGCASTISISRGAEAVLVSLPAAAIRPYRKSIEAAAGTPIRADRGGASLFANVLQGLVQQLADYAPANPGRLARHLVGLLAVSCSDEAAQDSSQNMILQNAMDYIERHLAEGDLTPDRIAEAQNVSTRTLHRLFERDGLTVSGWTRARRLENCRIDLLDDGNSGLTVSSIGARWGLYDAAHFSRLFKLSYGVSPRTYRMMSGDPHGPARQRQAYTGNGGSVSVGASPA